MKRIKLVLAVVAAMAAMTMVAAPAMAQRELQQFDDQGYVDQNFPSPSYTEALIETVLDIVEYVDNIRDIFDPSGTVQEEFGPGRAAEEYRETLEEVAGEESQEALDNYYDALEDAFEDAADFSSEDEEDNDRDRPGRDRPKGDGGGRGNGPGAGRG